MSANLVEPKANVKICKFKSFGDERGYLIALESNKNIPFEIKRVYYIYNTKSFIKRGQHAHKNLEQILICTKGSCKVLLDDGKKKEELLLSSPDVGIHISGLIWREMHGFSSDCVLMVLASDFYNENDYIRNYEEFYQFTKHKRDLVNV